MGQIAAAGAPTAMKPRASRHMMKIAKIARATWCVVLGVLMVTPTLAMAQHALSVGVGGVVLPKGKGTNAWNLTASVQMAGDSNRRTVLVLDYIASTQRVELFPPCASPGCTSTMIERQRTEYVGVGPMYAVRTADDHAELSLGASLRHQRSLGVTSWQFALTAGAEVYVLQWAGRKISVEVRANRFVTGGAATPWLVPIGLKLTM